MNKRKAKKQRKKVVLLLVDDMNLNTLNPVEYEKAMADYKNFVYKHCRYFHYKDKNKVFFYHFPAGESTKKFFEEKLKTMRRYKAQTFQQQLSLTDEEIAAIREQNQEHLN